MSVTFSRAAVTSLELGSPELGDTYLLDIGIVNRVNRGNEALVAYDSDWVKTRTKTLTFTRISDDKKDDIETFLIAVQGLQITYVDQNNYTWLGYITTSSFEFETQYRSCGRVFTLEFRGERQ